MVECVTILTTRSYISFHNHRNEMSRPLEWLRSSSMAAVKWGCNFLNIWFIFIIHIKHNKEVAFLHKAAKVKRHTDLQAVTSHHALTKLVSSWLHIVYILIHNRINQASDMKKEMPPPPLLWTPSTKKNILSCSPKRIFNPTLFVMKTP